jgi:signal transduction histidine kinase/CheY-like chemotaxis protein
LTAQPLTEDLCREAPGYPLPDDGAALRLLARVSLAVGQAEALRELLDRVSSILVPDIALWSAVDVFKGTRLAQRGVASVARELLVESQLDTGHRSWPAHAVRQSGDAIGGAAAPAGTPWGSVLERWPGAHWTAVPICGGGLILGVLTAVLPAASEPQEARGVLEALALVLSGPIAAALRLEALEDELHSAREARARAQTELHNVTSTARCMLWHATVTETDWGFHWDLRFPNEEAASRWLPLDLGPGERYRDAWYRSIPDEDREQLRTVSGEALRAGQSSYTQEFRCRERNGRVRWIAEHVYLEPHEPGCWRLVGVCTDLTARKEAEEALRRAQEELEQRVASRTLELQRMNQDLQEQIRHRARIEAELAAARDEALQGSRLKSEFLANMSHEIRTPLNGIIGMSDILLDTTLSEEQHELAEVIRVSSRALLEVINDILDFSKIEAGKIELEDVEFSLRTVVEESAEVVAPRAWEKRLTLVTHLDPAVPELLRGDPARLRQVLLNLLGNSVKFTERGEVTVRVRLARADESSAELRVEVSDSGIGLPPAALKRLFQPFVQADGTTTRKYGGTGLGLSICRDLVELMGGEIGVESSEGEGATFWFTVHLGTVASVANAEPGAPAPLAGKRAVVAVASAGARELLGATLAAAGLEVEAAATGAQAVRAARTGGRPVDFLLVGDELPDLRPAQLCRALIGGAGPAGAPPRLVRVASFDDRRGAPEGEWVACAATITLPARQSQLLDALKAALEAPWPPVLEAPPVAAVASAEGVPRAGVALGQDVLDSGGPPILVAEDNPVNARVARLQLQKLGFSSDWVTNGQEVVDALRTREYRLILLDCQMPVLDGFSATRLIREAERHNGRRQLIVAMTANAMHGDRERCIGAGMDDYLSKPVKLDQLEALLHRWLPGGGDLTPGGDGDEPGAPTGRDASEAPEPFDVAALHKTFGRDRETIGEMLRLFAGRMRSLPLELKAALRERNVSQLQMVSASARSSCDTLSARALSAALQQVAESAVAGDWETTRRGCDEVAEAIKEVESFARAY